MRREKLNLTCRIVLPLVLLLLCISSLNSCKKVSKEQEERICENIAQFGFDLALYNLSGSSSLSNPQTFYIPSQLEELYHLNCFEKGECYPVLEKYFVEKKGVIEASLFYEPSFEKADWVESLIIQVEEERIAEEISLMEEEYSQEEFIPQEYEKEIEKALDENTLAEEMIGRDNTLQIVQYDKEIFMPVKNRNLTTTIEASDGKITRKFYDDYFRLVKTENWNITNVKNATLVQDEEYYFEGDAFKPSQKVTKTKEKRTVSMYNEEGLLNHSEVFAIVEKTEDSKDKGKEEDKKAEPEKVEYLVSVFDWSYDEEGRVLGEKNKINYYDKDYKKLEYSFVKKHIYKYNDFGDEVSEDDKDKIPPDFEYFENDVLKMKNKYSAEKGTYTSQVFFEDDFAVKTYYEQYKKVREVYTVGKKVKRIKEYE